MRLIWLAEDSVLTIRRQGYSTTHLPLVVGVSCGSAAKPAGHATVDAARRPYEVIGIVSKIDAKDDVIGDSRAHVVGSAVFRAAMPLISLASWARLAENARLRQCVRLPPYTDVPEALEIFSAPTNRVYFDENDYTHYAEGFCVAELIEDRPSALVSEVSQFTGQDVMCALCRERRTRDLSDCGLCHSGVHSTEHRYSIADGVAVGYGRLIEASEFSVTASRSLYGRV